MTKEEYYSQFSKEELQKAMELANKYMSFHGIPITECIDATLEMARWKENQMIEKACDYIYSHAHVTTFLDIRLDKCSFNEFVENFKRVMNEE